MKVIRPIILMGVVLKIPVDIEDLELGIDENNIQIEMGIWHPEISHGFTWKIEKHGFIAAEILRFDTAESSNRLLGTDGEASADFSSLYGENRRLRDLIFG